MSCKKVGKREGRRERQFQNEEKKTLNCLRQKPPKNKTKKSMIFCSVRQDWIDFFFFLVRVGNVVHFLEKPYLSHFQYHKISGHLTKIKHQNKNKINRVLSLVIVVVVTQLMMEGTACIGWLQSL